MKTKFYKFIYTLKKNGQIIAQTSLYDSVEGEKIRFSVDITQWIKDKTIQWVSPKTRGYLLSKRLEENGLTFETEQKEIGG